MYQISVCKIYSKTSAENASQAPPIILTSTDCYSGDMKQAQFRGKCMACTAASRLSKICQC